MILKGVRSSKIGALQSSLEASSMYQSNVKRDLATVVNISYTFPVETAVSKDYEFDNW